MKRTCHSTTWHYSRGIRQPSNSGKTCSNTATTKWDYSDRHVSIVKNRVDRRDLESGARLHEDKSGLQALLRGEVRGAVSRRAGASFRAVLRPQVGASQAG